ncbi:hypothetical protein J4471_05020 [Candidatus Woesearchaeota archaeon]|nr:hypothetical protein [Candidatus Woesearchaeota archaeon]
MSESKQSSVTQNLKLDEFLRMVDVATTIRQKQEEINKQLNIHEVKAELKKKLQDTAQISGEQLTDYQIETAINNYLEGLYSFKEPTRDFGFKLAEIYAGRVKLLKKFGIPPLVGLAASGLIWLTAEQINSLKIKTQEKNIENVVEIAYQEKQYLLRETEETLSSPFVDQLPSVEKSKLQSQLFNSRVKLNSTDSFFQQYRSDGTTEDDITKDNYKEAGIQLASIQDSINSTKEEIHDSRLIIQTQEGLTLTKRNLENLIEEIRDLKPLEIFSRKAENTYSTGIGEIDRRNLNEAKQKEQELVNINKDISQYFELSDQTEVLYRNIISIAKEKEALEKGESIYKEAKQFVLSADVRRLSQTTIQLQDLNSLLNLEYTLRIVNKSGIKSGIDRYYTDSSGKRVSGYYLIVEGIDADGNPIPINIQSEESDQIEKVSMWGERVPQEVYEKVKADKIDNGIINNNIIGIKKKGYQKENITMQGVTKEGQITKW